MADERAQQEQARNTGPVTVVSEERDDGSYEIRAQAFDDDRAPSGATDSVPPPSARVEGSGIAGLRGLLVVVGLLAVGGYLLFVSPRGDDRQPPQVTSPDDRPSPVESNAFGETELRATPGPVRSSEAGAQPTIRPGNSPVLRRTMLRPEAVELGLDAPRVVEPTPSETTLQQDSEQSADPALLRERDDGLRWQTLQRTRSQRSDVVGAARRGQPGEAARLERERRLMGPRTTRDPAPDRPERGQSLQDDDESAREAESISRSTALANDEDGVGSEDHEAPYDDDLLDDEYLDDEDEYDEDEYDDEYDPEYDEDEYEDDEDEYEDDEDYAYP